VLKRLRSKLKTLSQDFSPLANLKNLIGRKAEKVMSTFLEKWLVAALGSWKTTALGLLGLGAVLTAEGLRLLDGDPETVANLEAVLVALSVFFGLSLAKDDDN